MLTGKCPNASLLTPGVFACQCSHLAGEGGGLGLPRVQRPERRQSWRGESEAFLMKSKSILRASPEHCWIRSISMNMNSWRSILASSYFRTSLSLTQPTTDLTARTLTSPAPASSQTRATRRTARAPPAAARGNWPAPQGSSSSTQVRTGRVEKSLCRVTWTCKPVPIFTPAYRHTYVFTKLSRAVQTQLHT